MAYSGLGYAPSGVVHLHAVGAPKVPGYFDEDNIKFIQDIIREKLRRVYTNVRVLVPRDSIIRVMQRVIEERYESVPKMNRRVVMYIMDEIIRHQTEVNRNLRLEEGYASSQLIVDNIGQKGLFPIDQMAKIENSKKVGGTLNFYLT